MELISIHYNNRYLVIGILISMLFLGPVLDIFSAGAELNSVHLYSYLWLIMVAIVIIISFKNEVTADKDSLRIKNGLWTRYIKWKDITDIVDITEPSLGNGNIFTIYLRHLRIYTGKKFVKIRYFNDEEFQPVMEYLQ